MAGAAEVGHALDLDPLGPGAVDPAPIAVSSRARSGISGSRAAFSSTVVPSARVAAIMRFSVPVTVTRSKTIRAPFSRAARAST